MEEVWVVIPSYENYSVSSEGRVRNDKYERIIQQSKTGHGVSKVCISNKYGRSTKSVPVLVASMFIPKPNAQFDTPIHLDNNQSNNSINNLAWRPLWFAWKYFHQFEDIDEFINVGPLSDRKTGFVYQDVVEAATMNGVLFREIRLSLVNKVPVYPTFQMFDWVKI